jgi:hypothetical protein
MGATYTHNYEAFAREVLTSPGMASEMLGYANRAAGAARAIAPVDEGGPHPGRYLESIHTYSTIRAGDATRTARAVGRVVADAPESVFVEFGTETQEAHHTLARALDSLGE